MVHYLSIMAIYSLQGWYRHMHKNIFKLVGYWTCDVMTLLLRCESRTETFYVHHPFKYQHIIIVIIIIIIIIILISRVYRVLNCWLV
jgi:hypothetical protein